ncbi:MAG: hypothetical protein ACYTG1_09130 [Planctomycetota bacterium]
MFYAPKDRVPISLVEPLFEDPSEFPSPSLTDSSLYLSSYCWSPAAMYNPEVFRTPDRVWRDPMWLAGGFRTPTYAQAKYPELKTHMWEHHWLQNATKDCNFLVLNGRYDNCEPYYYNHSVESAPATLFFDGHIEPLGQREAAQAAKRMEAQVGWGTWKIDTPLGGSYNQDGSCGIGLSGSMGGYFGHVGTDWTCASHNVLTMEGILGRDKDPG